MGRYCKAYPVEKFRQFSHWREQTENIRLQPSDKDENTSAKRSLTADSFLYLQENYVVTDGIFKDENIIFDEVTPAWKEFCHTVLEFEIPADASTPLSA
ncbi:hypothetical protein [Almyronema epifaneia]|uniref:Uncharacterized protein n=1 Tax=Almyronema epifaneia S1 TaxID=2991925 RepID=A0ABW6IJ21_9CYAN